MKRAKSLSGPDLAAALVATKDFKGATGNINMNAKRDAIKSAVILEIKDGKPTYVATVAP